GGVAAAGRDAASMSRQATPDEPAKEEPGFIEQGKAKINQFIDNVGGPAAAAGLGAAAALGGPEGAIAAVVMGHDGTATRKGMAVTRDIAGDNANPTKAAERAARRGDYKSTTDVDASIPERPDAPPPVMRPRGPQGGSTKAPPPRPPSWETTPAQ